MSEPQIAPSQDELLAAFETQLEPDLHAESSEPDPDPEPTDPEPPTPAVAAAETPKVDKRTREGRKASIQAEIDELAARKHAAKLEVDAEEARLVTLRADAARLVTQPRMPVAAPEATPVPEAAYRRYLAMPDAPKPAQFTGDNAFEEYQFAVGHFVANAVATEAIAAQQQAAQQQAAQVQAQQIPFQTRLHAEIAKDATFTQRLQQTPVDTRIIPFLHKHPQGPDVMVYLVEHPEIAQRLTTLNPIDQVGQIGEIAGLLKSRVTAAVSGPASPPPISKAKPLIKPVSAAPSASDDDDGDEGELSPEEFIRRGNKRDHRPMPRAASR